MTATPRILPAETYYRLVLNTERRSQRLLQMLWWRFRLEERWDDLVDQGSDVY